MTPHFAPRRAHPGARHRRQGEQMHRWKETMAGGSPEAERAEFDKLARDIMLVQLKNAKTASAHGVRREVDPAFHAKSTLATDRADLAFLDLADDLSAGYAQSGRAYPTEVRLSKAEGTAHP